MKTYGTAGTFVAATGGHVPLPLTPRPSGRDILTDLERARQRERKVLPPLAGPEPAPRPAKARRRTRPAAPDIRTEFVAPYLAGHSLGRIAADHHAGKDTVQRHLLLAGVHLRNDYSRCGRQATPLDEDRLLQLLAAGVRKGEIAEQLGTTRQTITRRIKALQAAGTVAA